MPRFSVKRAIFCIRQTQGLLALAARQIPCALATLEKAIAKHPELAEAVRESREETLDLAEFNLRRRVLDGEIPAIRFLLETQGKHRGYGREPAAAPILIQTSAQAAATAGAHITHNSRDVIAAILGNDEAVHRVQHLIEQHVPGATRPELDACLIGSDSSLPGDDRLPTPSVSLDLGESLEASRPGGSPLHSPKPNGNGQSPPDGH